MKKSRILIAFTVFSLILLPVLFAFGAGSVTQTLDKYPNANMRIWTLAFTGDSSKGTVPASTTTTAVTNDMMGWYIYTVETSPGVTGPTNQYDCTIKDTAGLDIAGGMLADRSSTVAEKIVPKVDTGNGLFGGVMVDSALTVACTGTSVASATWTMKAVLTK
jgi:hypothetical protein